MASLRLRNGVWFLDYRLDGKRQRVSTKTGDKKLAEYKLKELELKLFKGDPDLKAKAVECRCQSFCGVTENIVSSLTL